MESDLVFGESFNEELEVPRLREAGVLRYIAGTGELRHTECR